MDVTIEMHRSRIGSYNNFMQAEKSNMWYAQIVCYHVFVPLLLRLSNDVEENPGPRNINEIVDCTFTVHADCHQGNASMFGSNAGKQCVAMSLCSIVYNEIKSDNIWDTLIMNKILDYGNNLYGIITRSINNMWYAQIVCYHVFVPLLLRLSNDVE